MSLLSAEEIAAMQAVADEALPDTCTIERRSLAADGGGGWSESWAQVGGTIPCRIAKDAGTTSQAEREQGDRDTSTVYWKITLPEGTDIKAADRILSAGRIFEIDSVDAPISWEISRRVSALEIT